MRVMYKADKSCNCDPEQVSALEAAGWSLIKPTQPTVETPKVVDAKKVSTTKIPKEEPQEQSGV